MNYKKSLVKYLKQKDIKNIHQMFAESRNYFNMLKITMGGTYQSFGEEITVDVYINKEKETFTVKMLEIL